MKKTQLGIYIVFIVILGSSCLPVNKKEEDKKSDEETTKDENNLEVVLEYERYLKEVVDVLESDPEFRRKLDKAPEADIRSGKIAQELEYVSHNVRSKLDEIKRREIERLRQLASKQYELTNDIDREHLKIGEHLNHENEHTFEIDDLKKLILKTSQDLAEADKKRREEFKTYELQKEFEKQSKLKEMSDEERKKYEAELQRKHQEKQNKHAKIHHPGNKAQLEEVWEKQDQMEGQEFDPRMFFAMHDIDGNGVWDETELKALFVKELDKIYETAQSHDDLRERAEEMERMREHVFKESDTNRDGLISFQEFLDQTKREEFRKDPGWETVDNIPQFTHEEYLEYERKRQAEIQHLINQGILPPHQNMPPVPVPMPQAGHPIPDQHKINQQYHQYQLYNHPEQQQYHQTQQQPHQPPQQQQHYQQPPQQYQQPPQQQQYQQPPQQQQYQQTQQQYQQPQQQYQQPQQQRQPQQQQQQTQQQQQPPQQQQQTQQHQQPPQQQQQPPQQQQQNQQPQQQTFNNPGKIEKRNT